MSTRTLEAVFPLTGLTGMGYQLRSAAGANVGSRVTGGLVEWAGGAWTAGAVNVGAAYGIYWNGFNITTPGVAQVWTLTCGLPTSGDYVKFSTDGLTINALIWFNDSDDPVSAPGLYGTEIEVGYSSGNDDGIIVASNIADAISGYVTSATLLDNVVTITSFVGERALPIAVGTGPPDVAQLVVGVDDIMTEYFASETFTEAARFDALATAAVVAAIKVITDQFVFTTANQVDANALSGGGATDPTTITNVQAVYDAIDRLLYLGIIAGTQLSRQALAKTPIQGQKIT